MPSPTPARTLIRELRVINFRRFEDLSVVFDPYFNVIVAENGGGKTAILDAVAITFRPFVDTMAGETQSRGIAIEDVRLLPDPEGTMNPYLPTSLEAQVEIGGRPDSWRRERTSRAKFAKPPKKEASEIKRAASELGRHLQEYAERRLLEAPVLPLLAYYGTGRQHDQLKLTERKKATGFEFRGSAYIDSLSPSSSWQAFADWFERMSYEAQGEAATAVPSPHKPKQMLECIQQATNQVLSPSGWHSIAWDFVQGKVVASHPKEGRLPIEQLSDGSRMVIALVADIAQRAARLNPQFGSDAAQKTPGIVLVDEIDMALHPRWQQRIVPALRATFPLIQWIVTTHSAYVLTTVSASSIRVLDSNGRIHQPGTETQGHSANYILADIFGVSPVPPEEIVERLENYRHLIEEGRGQSEEATSLRAKLEAHYGQGHPVLLEADRLQRLQAFKLRRKLEG